MAKFLVFLYNDIKFFTFFSVVIVVEGNMWFKICLYSFRASSLQYMQLCSNTHHSQWRAIVPNGEEVKEAGVNEHHSIWNINLFLNKNNNNNYNNMHAYLCCSLLVDWNATKMVKLLKNLYISIQVILCKRFRNSLKKMITWFIFFKVI